MQRCTSIKLIFAVVAFVCLFSCAEAADSVIGTWVLQKTTSAKNQLDMTMVIEAWGNQGGRKFTYNIRFPNKQISVMTIESPFDGTDVPVLVDGKPTGETMGIKRVDDYHSVTVLKLNGKEFGISHATVSADFNMITVENEYTGAMPGVQAGKQIEIWRRR
jgi:hypothetical protein